MVEQNIQRVARVIVRGRVQGVFFRDWTRRKAQEMGLDGWVRNRRDGTVEALIAGDPAMVEEMILALEEGSPQAMVDEVTVETADEVPKKGFHVRATE